MKQFGFETNIEHRSPFTGNVFMIDRMTSQWAEEHPLDVDAYIEQVAQKHGADVERVRLFFNYGLGKKGEAWATHCPAKHRDKVKKDPKTGIGILTMGQWPEYVNGCEPALIEAWNKAGEYHTKGLRLGDVLPEQTPACKITRLEDGSWIALFPKDMHLLTDSADSARGQVPGMEAVVKDDLTTETTDSTSTSISNTNSQSKEVATAAAGENNPGGAVREDSAPVLESNDAPAARGQVPGIGADDIEAMGNQATPVRGLSPDMGADIPASTDLPGTCPLASEAKPKRQRRQKKAAAEKPQPQQLSLFDEELMAEQQEESVEKKLLRSAGYLAAAAAAIVFVWETGLIIPLGLIGLGTAGLLK